MVYYFNIFVKRRCGHGRMQDFLAMVMLMVGVKNMRPHQRRKHKAKSGACLFGKFKEFSTKKEARGNLFPSIHEF